MLKKRRRHSSAIAWGIGAIALITGVASFTAGVNSSSQVAVGAAADQQCTGDYDVRCQYPNIHPQSRKRCLIGKPCQDITSGNVTSGTCREYGKCLGEQTGGMMPMLPMLPMMMPMPSMPSQPSMEPCPTNATSTNASTTNATWRGDCIPQERTSSTIGNLIFGHQTDTSAPASQETENRWSFLTNLLGGSDSSSEETKVSSEDETGGAGVGFSIVDSIRQGVSTIIRLTTITTGTTDRDQIGNNQPEAGTVHSGGYYTGNSTFTSTNISTGQQEEQGAAAVIQNLLSDLATSLRNLLASFKQ